jgi:hypothetical protein
VFEKHRRGRKPGSKCGYVYYGVLNFSLTARTFSRLSDASKLLRRIEKNMHSHQRIDGHSGRSASVSETTEEISGSRLPGSTASSSSSGSHRHWPQTVSGSDDVSVNSNPVQQPDARRHSFFSTILNPPELSLAPSMPPYDHFDDDMVVFDVPKLSPSSPQARDPVEAGLMSSHMANMLVEQFIIRLNPFIVVRIFSTSVPVDRH